MTLNTCGRPLLFASSPQFQKVRRRRLKLQLPEKLTRMPTKLPPVMITQELLVCVAMGRFHGGMVI